MNHLSFGATRLRLFFSFVLISTIAIQSWAQKPAPAPLTQPVKPAATAPATDLVTLTATVINSKRAVVTDLVREDFELLESYLPLEIESFSSEDEPASVVIVYDNSGSTANWKAMEVAQSVGVFLQYSNPENEYSLIMIGDGPNFRVSQSRGPGQVADAFAQIATEPSNGSSPIYDACNMGLEALKRSTHSRRVMLVISDGQDSYSRLRFNELESRLKHSNVMVYSAAIVDPRFASGTNGNAPGEEQMRTMAKVTGGFPFTPKDKKALRIGWEYIAYELRHQYRISFRPTSSTAKDSWSTVSVRFPVLGSAQKREAMSIRTKGGYFRPQIVAETQLGPSSPPIR